MNGQGPGRLQLSDPEETEEERERRLRMERAARLRALARKAGRAGNIGLKQLSEMPIMMQVAVLGLPSSVALEEARALDPRRARD